MKTVFKSTRHILFRLLFLFFPLALIVILGLICFESAYIDNITNLKRVLIISLSFLASLIAIWMISLFYGTRYIIESNKLFYKCGINSGAINISDISSISKAKYLSAGNRPAMDLTGFIVIYSGGRSTFVSPENPDLFIESLIKVNSAITVFLIK